MCRNKNVYSLKAEYLFIIILNRNKQKYIYDDKSKKNN
jgi:hypothetical protein